MKIEDKRESFDYNDEMCVVSSHCKNFKKRRNVNSFNMSDYRGCDNCVNNTPQGTCCMNQNGDIQHF